MQENSISIQQELTEKLSTILQQQVAITGCGRTDAGVHASEFYAHFDTEKIDIEYDLIIHKLNTMLHQNIAIESLIPVKSEAHARFDATKRSYTYRISRVKDAFRPFQVYRFNIDLDIESMNKACELLLGEKDFGCFCKAQTDNHTNICTIYNACWVEEKAMIRFDITANRFLRNMVRSIVGTMLDIGQGKTTLAEFEEIILSKDRTQAGRSVPAHGLYLAQVEYPPEIFLKDS
jgi:tRNA pseudouridine38-40 synthase